MNVVGHMCLRRNDGIYTCTHTEINHDLYNFLAATVDDARQERRQDIRFIIIGLNRETGYASHNNKLGA